LSKLLGLRRRIIPRVAIIINGSGIVVRKKIGNEKSKKKRILAAEEQTSFVEVAKLIPITAVISRCINLKPDDEQ